MWRGAWLGLLVPMAIYWGRAVDAEEAQDQAAGALAFQRHFGAQMLDQPPCGLIDIFAPADPLGENHAADPGLGDRTR